MITLLRMVSLRYLRRNRMRVLLAIGAISLGVAVVVATWILNAGTLAALQRTVDGISGRATLQVSGAAGGIPQELVDDVRAVPGVLAAAPVIEERLESPDAGPGKVLLLGVDPAFEGLVRDHRSGEIDADALKLMATHPNAALLSAGLARRAGKQPGDPMIVRAPAGERRIMVAGILEPVGPARVFDDSLLVMPLPFAQLLFARAGRVDRIDIVTAPTGVAAVEERLRAALAGRALVSRPSSRSHEMESVLFGMKAMLTVVSVLALLVGAFLVYNTVSVSLVERRSEIALLRAIGGSRRRIAALLIGEQVAQGLLGGALGCGLGVAGAELSRRMLSTVVTRAYFEVEIAGSGWGLGPIAFGVGAGGLAAFLASLSPVKRELASDPIVGLLGASSAGSGSRLSPVARAAALVAVAGIVGALLTVARGRLPHAAIAAGVLSLAGLFLLVTPATRAAARMLAWPLGRLFGFPGRLACRQFRRADERTVLTVIAIAVGAALAFEVQVTLASSQAEIVHWIDRTVAGDMMVTRVGLLEPSISIPSLPPEAADQLEAIPGIRQAAEVRLSRLQLAGEQVLLIAAAERVDDASISFLDGDPVAGKRRLYAGEGVVVSESFRAAFGLGFGDTVALPGVRGTVDAEILGVIVDYSWPRGIVFLEIGLYRELFQDTLVDELIVTLQPGADADAVRHDIRARLGTTYPDLFLITNPEFRAEIDDMVQNFFMLSHAQSVVTLAVAFFGVLNTLMIQVLLRRRELAMLRAVGATRRQVVLAITCEGVLAGVTGALMGVAFGAWIGYVAVEHAAPEEQGWRFGTRIPYGVAGALLLACALTALVASIAPALRAARWNDVALRQLSVD